MRNYFMYENKRNNTKFLIEYPKLFATDRHWLDLILHVLRAIWND